MSEVRRGVRERPHSLSPVRFHDSRQFEVLPECAAQLLGSPGEAESDPEKQAYADFTEKLPGRSEARARRQLQRGCVLGLVEAPTHLHAIQPVEPAARPGTPRAGMTAPPTGTETTEERTPAGCRPRRVAAARRLRPLLPHRRRRPCLRPLPQYRRRPAGPASRRVPAAEKRSPPSTSSVRSATR